MLSINQRKLITSLRKKKNREKEALFVIEGDKIVMEYIDAGSPVELLAAKPEWLARLPEKTRKAIPVVAEVNFDELKKVSSLTTPHNALALVRIEKESFKLAELENKLSLAIENIQDPGNLGTIIRTAGWFGIRNILCSPDSVDKYNPKVIQASMGALLSVSVSYLDLQETVARAIESGIAAYATTLDGKSLYTTRLQKGSIVMFGNESSGLSKELISIASASIKIPSFNEGEGVESLNVATTAAIICGEFRRLGF